MSNSRELVYKEHNTRMASQKYTEYLPVILVINIKIKKVFSGCEMLIMPGDIKR